MNSFSHIIFYVQDVEKTLAFYEKAFGIERAFIDPSGQYGQLNTGTGYCSIGFASWELAQQNLARTFARFSPKELPGCEISFTAEDLSQSLERALEAGAELIASSQEKPWGQTIAYVRDFNGILIELCTAMVPCCAEESSPSCCL